MGKEDKRHQIPDVFTNGFAGINLELTSKTDVYMLGESITPFVEDDRLQLSGRNVTGRDIKLQLLPLSPGSLDFRVRSAPPRENPNLPIHVQDRRKNLLEIQVRGNTDELLRQGVVQKTGETRSRGNMSHEVQRINPEYIDTIRDLRLEVTIPGRLPMKVRPSEKELANGFIVFADENPESETLCIYKDHTSQLHETQMVFSIADHVRVPSLA